MPYVTPIQYTYLHEILQVLEFTHVKGHQGANTKEHLCRMIKH